MAKVIKNNANKLLADFCVKYSKCRDYPAMRHNAIEMCKVSETNVKLTNYGIVDLALVTLISETKNNSYIANVFSLPNFLN